MAPEQTPPQVTPHSPETRVQHRNTQLLHTQWLQTYDEMRGGPSTYVAHLGSLAPLTQPLKLVINHGASDQLPH